MNLANIWEQIRARPVYMLLGGVILLMFLAPRLFRTPSRRRRRPIGTGTASRSKTKSRRSGTRKTGTRAGKKPWQVKGSPEARAYMRKLRRMQGKK